MNKHDILPRYPTGAAINFLSARLGIQYSGQDWEIVNADAARLEEFVQIYEQEKLDDDQRFLLMALIIASYDELARSRSDPLLWQRIRKHLCERFSLHAYTVEYWSLTDMISDDECPDTQFAVTPQMREILSQFLGRRENWPTAGFALRRFCEPVGGGPETVLNSIEIAACRNGSGFCASWSIILGRNGGQRFFDTAVDAQLWAEAGFGVKSAQWDVL
jgi:hypothetical protein